MTRRYTEYGPVRLYRGVSLRLSVVLRVRSRGVSTNAGDAEKLSAYECGFNPFDDARSRFDIRFYLVAIRFILFDLEASFRFPWARTMGEQTSFGYRTMRDFMRELVVGYVYAWKIGALEWEASGRMRRSGRRVVRSPNPVHSVLYRVMVFVNGSRRRFLLQVEFRARILRVVYVGAIAVLFRFVVMMLNLSEAGGNGTKGESRMERGQIYTGMTVRFARVRGGRYGRASDPRVPKTKGVGSERGYVEWVKRRDTRTGIQAFGQVLYTDGRRYVVSAGMVLLVAMVGAIVLTLKVRTFASAKRQQVDQQRSRDGDRAILRVKNR